MKKYPFTTSGVMQLQETLYAQSDAVLLAEAEQIERDFIQWLADHFELSEEQLSFLSLFNAPTRLFLSSQTSFAIANRLPVMLYKPTESGQRSSKIIKPESTLRATLGADGQIQAAGALTIVIRY